MNPNIIKYKELSQQQIFSIQKRLPSFELSYETISHKKVFNSYPVSLAIPSGKKYFVWFSFYQDKDVCYMMEINREKKIVNISIATDLIFDSSFSLGTILYGTIVLDNPSRFIIEDIYYYKGVPLKQYTFGEKLGYLELFLENNSSIKNNTIHFFLPFLWGIQSDSEPSILQEFEIHRPKIPYQVHHLQLRKLNELSPYLNINLYLRRFDLNRRRFEMGQNVGDNRPSDDSNVPFEFLKGLKSRDESKKNAVSQINPRDDPMSNDKTKLNVRVHPRDDEGGRKYFGKPQYKFPTVFLVSADIQYDIYHLHAFGKNKEHVLYDIAYIQNIKVSKMMNDLFRNIRENQNLDYIEESDDEDDFENIAADKYVDLHKMIPMEFLFNGKFKKWVPIRVVESDAYIVHISKL